MISIATGLLVALFGPLQDAASPAPGNPTSAKTDFPWSWAPQWTNLGIDARHRQLWVRMQRDPALDATTLIDFYADGHLVKSKLLAGDLFIDDIAPAVAAVGGQWFVFYDEHPGAGDTWFTDYIVIRRRDLAFEKQGKFEHGWAGNFEATHRFYEFNLLKYQGDHRFQDLGVYGYRIIEWQWDARGAQFKRKGHWYAPYLPATLHDRWEEPRAQSLNGALVGTLGYFQPAEPAKYGLPKDSHFRVTPGGDGVELDEGKLTYDELNLMHGLTALARLDYAMGSLDPHHPPQLERSSQGLVLTLTTCVFRQVRFSQFLVTIKPYKISLLKTWLEPEWTPFQAVAKPDHVRNSADP